MCAFGLSMGVVCFGLQGMTVRTAGLPGAGNLLGWAGEDLSGLPE